MSLSRYYKDQPTREREVAMYIDGHYVTRGPASEGRQSARDGFRGIGTTVAPARIAWELDAPTFGKDRPAMNWQGATLSSAEFLAWLDS